MKTVASILSAHAKTIKDLSTLKVDLNKKDTALIKERKAIEKQQREVRVETSRANAGIAYLGGLFEAVNAAGVSAAHNPEPTDEVETDDLI